MTEPTPTQPPTPTVTPISDPPAPAPAAPVPPAIASARPSAPLKPLAPAPNPPLTTAQAFFREGFGCVGQVVVQIAAIFVIVFVVDWLYDRKQAREAAKRAATSETAARLADEFAKETDADGRFVRKPEGELPETDAWGHPLRLSYPPGWLPSPFTDRLEVRSAGPDGVWQNWDDVTASHSSRISNAALAREAGGGLIDAARDRLRGKPDDKKNEKDKKDEKKK